SPSNLHPPLMHRAAHLRVRRGSTAPSTEVPGPFPQTCTRQGLFQCPTKTTDSTGPRLPRAAHRCSMTST
ncbi:MAG: hypothetical protein ACPGPE_17080, partial [Planctomycetota bacterium]